MENEIKTASVKVYGQTFSERDIVKVMSVLHALKVENFPVEFSEVIPEETLSVYIKTGTEVSKKLKKLEKQQEREARRDAEREQERKRIAKEIEESRKALGLL